MFNNLNSIHTNQTITMRKMNIFIQLCFVGLLLSSATGRNGTEKTKSLERDAAIEQICTGETFQPRCNGGRHDVIVIMSAVYGRMNFGRCIEEEPELVAVINNPRFIGCAADVKHILDLQCSGLSECGLRINNQNFQGVKPCLAGLQMYLEASYVCVKVPAESRHCTVALTNEPQHIVGGSASPNAKSDTVGCGAESQPWSVEAMTGQRIAVSLMEFGVDRNDSSQLPECDPSFGHIIDKSSRRNVTICKRPSESDQKSQADHSSKTPLYVSSSNQLTLITKETINHKFIVRVEAVGCSDLAPPSDSAWLKRVDDQITVGCYMSRQSWQLNCVNGVWTGTVGVCSQLDNEEHAPLSTDPQHRSNSAKYQDSTEIAALAAVASAGAALCCLVICIGVLCLRKQRVDTRKKNGSSYQPYDAKYNEDTNRVNTGLVLSSQS